MSHHLLSSLFVPPSVTDYNRHETQLKYKTNNLFESLNRLQSVFAIRFISKTKAKLRHVGLVSPASRQNLNVYRVVVMMVS